MDKESLIALQKIDCNCNDCKFMDRNIDRYEESLKAKEWKDKREFDKANVIEKQIAKMKFQFNRNKCMINYGVCSNYDSKFWNKEVTFIPGNCQIHTQGCFKHRR